jgi:hypothetical protein
MIKAPRNVMRRAIRPLRERVADSGSWSGDGWSLRSICPLVSRQVASCGFLRDRLHVVTGVEPLPIGLSDEAVDATLSLMLRRG